MNYPSNLTNIEDIQKSLNTQKYQELLLYDQLNMEKKEKRVFDGFNEAKIKFLPTSKYNKGSRSFSKSCAPSYTDRIFYIGEVTVKEYNSYSSLENSEHNPVYMRCKVKVSQQSIFQVLSPSPIIRRRRSMESFKSSKNFQSEIFIVEKNIDPSKWELHDFIFKENINISQANYTVRKCTHKVLKKDFAAKIIPKETENEIYLNYLYFLHELDSPFVIKYHKYFSEKKFLVIITDLLEYGDLESLLAKKKLSESEAKFYIASILLGLKSLHKGNIIHRDLKPHNIKLTSNGYPKLGGFNLSKTITTRFSHNGKIDYLSPQVILNTFQGKQDDYWSLGILTYELVCGATPFSTYDEVIKIQKILEGEIHIPNEVSPKAKSFITSLLKKEKNQRLGCGKNGIEEIMNHQWLKGMDWNLLEKMEMKAPLIPEKFTPQELLEPDFLFNDFKNAHPDDEIIDEKPQKYEKYGRLRSPYQTKSVSLDAGEIVKIFVDDVKEKYLYEDKKIDNLDVEELVKVQEKLISKKRLGILNEFLFSEQSYVDHLEIIIQNFCQPLAKILSPEVHQKIFSSIQTIYKVNSTFLEMLENSIHRDDFIDESPKTILSFLKSFKLYVSYIQNYNTSFNTITSEKVKNIKFKQFLKSKYTELQEKGIFLNIHSLLIMPIQRLPRYQLLCEDLANNTPEEEKEIIEKATKEIKEIVTYCNEKTAEYEVLNLVFHLQRKFKLPVDNSQQLILIMKQNERLYLYENEKILVQEFAIIEGFYLVEAKSKIIKVAYKKIEYELITEKEMKGIEFQGENKIKILVENDKILNRFLTVLKTYQ